MRRPSELIRNILKLALFVQTGLCEAAVIKKEMSNLGISAEDKKKRFELDKQLVEKLKLALPYWEKAEKLNPSDQEVLDTLYESMLTWICRIKSSE